MKKLEVVFGVVNSDLYHKDTDDFSIEMEDGETKDEYMDRVEEKKWEYYTSDFWHDCDYLKIRGVGTFNWREVEGEIIVGDYGMSEDGEIIYQEDLDDDTLELIEKILLHYMSDDWNTGSIDPDFDGGDWNAKLTNGDEMDIIVKYRGGQGYTYAFCGYKMEQFLPDDLFDLPY